MSKCPALSNENEIQVVRKGILLQLARWLWHLHALNYPFVPLTVSCLTSHSCSLSCKLYTAFSKTVAIVFPFYRELLLDSFLLTTYVGEKEILFILVDLAFEKGLGCDPISRSNFYPVGVWYDLIKYAMLGGRWNSRCSLFPALNPRWCPNDGWKGNCSLCHDAYLQMLPFCTELC